MRKTKYNDPMVAVFYAHECISALDAPCLNRTGSLASLGSLGFWEHHTRLTKVCPVPSQNTLRVLYLRLNEYNPRYPPCLINATARKQFLFPSRNQIAMARYATYSTVSETDKMLNEYIETAIVNSDKNLRIA